MAANDMQLSDDGLADLGTREGIAVAPYFDGVHVLTWGVGHTAAAGAPDPHAMPLAMPPDTQAAIVSALSVFKNDLRLYEQRVNAHVTQPMTQAQFDALVSFDLNTGGVWYRRGDGTWTSAVAVQKFNAGDVEGAADALMNWCNPPSLEKRRSQERDLFLTGQYLTDPIAVWGTDGNGTRQGVIETLTRDQFIQAARAA